MKNPHTIVIKIGTSTLTRGKDTLSKKSMLEIAQQMAALHQEGRKLVLVSSGSIFAGKEVLHQQKIEKSLPGKQMLSSVGQVRLMEIWTELFAIFGITIGQLLLTRGDFANRQGYLNVRNTIESLLAHNIIPVINENDSVAIREIKVGDNDNLSALVANLIAADLLVLLTDQEGLFTADPSKDPTAKLIPEVMKIDEKIFNLAGATTKAMGHGTGGMYTKVEAASLAVKSGTPTVIASSHSTTALTDIAHGKHIGTLFHAETTPIESRKRWLLSERSQGMITVDKGAVEKLTKQGASLLPVGITGTSSTSPFERGAVITVTGPSGEPIAVGIANYAQDDIEKIKGGHSNAILDSLGYSYGPEVIHRDNMALITLKGSS